MAAEARISARHRSLSLLWRGRPVKVTAWEREAGREWICFLHGLGCSKRSFRAAYTCPALKDYSLLALDLVGFGGSARDEAFDYDLAHQADLCAQVLDAHADRPVHLVAHSLGGTVAALLPSATLARLRSLVLIEGRLLAASCSYSRLVSRLEEEEFIARHYPAWCARLIRDPQLTLDLEEADPQAVYRSACSLYRWVCEGDLPARLEACPELNRVFLYGEQNQSLGEIEAVRGMRALVVPGCGHFPMHENPEGFYAVLARALAGS